MGAIRIVISIHDNTKIEQVLGCGINMLLSSWALGKSTHESQVHTREGREAPKSSEVYVRVIKYDHRHNPSHSWFSYTCELRRFEISLKHCKKKVCRDYITDTIYSLQSLKYLLPGPLQNKFSDPCSKLLVTLSIQRGTCQFPED